MRKTVSITAAAVMLIIAVTGGCDRRGGIVTGVPVYVVDAEAVPSTITVNDSSRIHAIVHEYASEVQLDGVPVNFYALDFGYVTPTAVSSSVDPTGLRTAVYFYSLGNQGTAEVIAQAVYGDSALVADTDTVVISVQ